MYNNLGVNPVNPQANPQANPQVSVNVGANGYSGWNSEEQRQYLEYQEFIKSEFYKPIAEAKDELISKEKEAFLDWKDSLNPQSNKMNELMEVIKAQSADNAELKSMVMMLMQEKIETKEAKEGDTDA